MVSEPEVWHTSDHDDITGEMAPVLGMAATGSRRGRPTGVEANARLTATTGALLIVLLAAEGVTIASIGPLVSWHIGIGLALLPPVGIKVGSTLWRFSMYYLHNARYRSAGPPLLVLRLLGPVVMVSTAAVFASGIALWLAGPAANQTLGTLHKATFVVWFGAMALHVLAHVGRSARLTRADLSDALTGTERVRHARVRQALVLSSLLAGVVLGVATRGLVSGWGVWAHVVH